MTGFAGYPEEELETALAEARAERDRWKDRWAGAVEDAQEARNALYELESALSWGTTCLNCSSLLDASYEQYVRAERAEDTYATLVALLQNTIARDFG